MAIGSVPSPICVMAKPFIIFGHRGAKGLAPENTVLGIRKALEIGVDGIEIDVHQTHDELWVMHDEDVARTTNGKGLLSDLTPEILRGLDAGRGEPIPILAEVLDAVEPPAVLNIELKHAEAAEKMTALVMERVKAGAKWDHFLVSSFYPEALGLVRQASSEIPIGVLVHKPENLPQIWAACGQLGAIAIHPHHKLVNADLVEEANRRGLKVYAFTVNNLKEGRRLRDLGVDGVFTDFPDKFQKLRILAE